MGHQTRRPFNKETEKVLDPLELVSFDLWDHLVLNLLEVKST